jgi:hypothetical protein
MMCVSWAMLSAEYEPLRSRLARERSRLSRPLTLCFHEAAVQPWSRDPREGLVAAVSVTLAGAETAVT